MRLWPDSLSQEAYGTVDRSQLEEHQLSEAGPRTLVVVVNGRISEELSTIGELPSGVYVGPVAQAPAEVTAHLVSTSSIVQSILVMEEVSCHGYITSALARS